MEESNLIQILRLIWSWGRGAQTGAGLLCIIYMLFPNIFPGMIGIDLSLVLLILISIGGLLGAGFHGLLQRITNLIAEIPESKNNQPILIALKELEKVYLSEILPSEVKKEIKDIRIKQLKQEVDINQKQIEGDEDINTEDK